MEMTSILSRFSGKRFQAFAIYLGTSIINKAIPFLLLPVLTRYLSSEEYGIVSIYQVMISFSLAIVGMGMPINISRNFFTKDKNFIGGLIFNLITVLVVSSTMVLLAIALYDQLGGELFSVPARWLYALPIIAFMNMVNTFNLTVLRNEKRALRFGYLELGRTGLDLSVTLILVVGLLKGWEGRLAGVLTSTIVIGIISIYQLKANGYLVFNFNGKHIRSILKISTPMIPHILGGAIIILSDRVFIEYFYGISEVGIYAVGYQFGLVINLITAAVSLSWSPWLHELLARNEYGLKIRVVRATYLIWISYLMMAVVLSIISYFLLPIMTSEEYHGGKEFVIWVAVGYAFQGMYTLVFPYGVHVGKTSYLGITTFVAAGVNLLANYILIKWNGPVGAAQATLLSYFLMFISVWWYSNRLYKMPWLSIRTFI